MIKTNKPILLAVLIGQLSTPLSLSQDTPPGFDPGKRSFNNPFAEDFDEGIIEDVESGYYDENGNFISNSPRQRGSGSNANEPSKGPTPSPGIANDKRKFSQPPSTRANVSLGGTKPGGIEKEADVPYLFVNSETGQGSNEVVTDFNFPDADIMDIAKALGKLTGKNFILDKDVKGKVTIISNSPITVGDAWKAFLTALDINGFTLVPSGKYLRISRQRDARDKQLRTFTGNFSPNTDALITRIFPLKYIGADEVARTLRSFVPPNSRIIHHDQTNTIIVTDTGSNIQKLASMLEILDVEGFDAGIYVINIKHASATDIAKLIDDLIPSQGGGTPGVGRVRRTARTSSFTARRTKEGGLINTVIADERTNSLIVHANGKGVDQVKDLVKKLDREVVAEQGSGRVHVIYLQFANAEEVSQTLNNLSSGSSSRNRPRIGSNIPGAGNPLSQQGASLFEGEIKISPDKATNSLVITASPTDFTTLKRVVSQIDIPRDEVYVEVVIMEIDVSSNFDWSANIINPTNGIGATNNTDLISFVQNPAGLTGLVLGFATGGSVDVKTGSGDDTISIRSVQGLIKLFQSYTNTNVLATPQIMTMDNTEATFETAELVPVPTVTQTSTGSQVGVTQQRVSLSITIKPQINKISNFVKLDVQTKLADFSGRSLPPEVQKLALGTLERNAKTTVSIADGDTVVMGGLIKDSVRVTENKVPLLGDIPILGWLFKSKGTVKQKNNLMLFMTPHIIRRYEKVREILDKKLAERDKFLVNTVGGKDPMKEKRDDIIRSLPDLKEVMKPVENPITEKVKEDQEKITVRGGGSRSSSREDDSTLDPFQNAEPFPTEDNGNFSPPPPPPPGFFEDQ